MFDSTSEKMWTLVYDKHFGGILMCISQTELTVKGDEGYDTEIMMKLQSGGLA